MSPIAPARRRPARLHPVTTAVPVAPAAGDIMTLIALAGRTAARLHSGATS